MTPSPSSPAETAARDVLIWLADQPETLGAFLGESGLAPDELRRRATDPEFLGFLLDFVLADEARLLEAAAATDIPPERLARLRAALPGGDAPFWT